MPGMRHQAAASLQFAGLRQCLGGHVDLRVVAECANARELMDVVFRQAADVILLDLSVAGQSGVDALRAVKARAPEVAVLILSGIPEQHDAATLLRHGAAGHLSKDCDPQEIATAIRTAAQGRRDVTHSTTERLAADLGKPLPEAARTVVRT